MEYFFPDSIRGVIKALIYTFRDIHVKNFDNGPKEVTGDSPRPHKPWAKDIRVPIKFGPRDKIYDTRVEDRYGDGQKYYIILPTCALELTGLIYAPDRQNNINALRYFYDNESDISELNQYFEDEMPLAFNMNFTLHFRTDNLSHFTQITEQVLYQFRPNMVIAVKEFSFLNLERDLNVILNNVNQSFSQEITEEQQRTIEFSFDLSVHGFIYSPIELESLIKEIKASTYFINPDNTIDLNGHGWLSRTSPKPQDDYNLTPWEAQTGNQVDDSTFRTINDGSSGNQAEIQITQDSKYYGYGPELMNIEQINAISLNLDFGNYVDDNFSIDNFEVEGVPGTTQPDYVALDGGDPSSVIVVTINNLNQLNDGDEFVLTFSGLTRGGFEGPPRRVVITYQGV